MSVSAFSGRPPPDGPPPYKPGLGFLEKELHETHVNFLFFVMSLMEVEEASEIL